MVCRIYIKIDEVTVCDFQISMAILVFLVYPLTFFLINGKLDQRCY